MTTTTRSTIRFADRVTSMQESPTLAVLNRATSLIASGVDIVDFGPGEPDFATPRAVAERLNAEVTKVTGRPAVRKLWAEQGAQPMTMTVAEFEKHLNADIAKWAKVVKISGAKADQ